MTPSSHCWHPSRLLVRVLSATLFHLSRSPTPRRLVRSAVVLACGVAGDLVGSQQVQGQDVLAHWRGSIDGRRPTKAEVALVAPLQQSVQGGSGAFLALASDQNQYWVKPSNNGQSPRVPVTEQLVARAGRLIGAPVCIVRTIEITADTAGWPYRPGLKLEPGIAHASLAIHAATETRSFETNRTLDQNAERHAYLMALYDWCWGGDDQWLMATTDEHRYYSHDHGWYLPPTGPGWTAESLLTHVAAAHEMAADVAGISAAGASKVAEALMSVTREQILEAVAMIPSDWPVSNDELEAVAFFLDQRRQGVAERIRRRFGICL